MSSWNPIISISPTSDFCQWPTKWILHLNAEDSLIWHFISCQPSWFFVRSYAYSHICLFINFNFEKYHTIPCKWPPNCLNAWCRCLWLELQHKSSITYLPSCFECVVVCLFKIYQLHAPSPSWPTWRPSEVKMSPIEINVNLVSILHISLEINFSPELEVEAQLMISKL